MGDYEYILFKAIEVLEYEPTAARAIQALNFRSAILSAQSTFHRNMFHPGTPIPEFAVAVAEAIILAGNGKTARIEGEYAAWVVQSRLDQIAENYASASPEAAAELRDEAAELMNAQQVDGGGEPREMVEAAEIAACWDEAHAFNAFVDQCAEDEKMSADHTDTVAYCNMGF